MELIHNTKLKFEFFEILRLLKKLQTFSKKNRKYVDFVGVFVKEIVTFNIGFGFVVLKSIW